MDKVNRHPYYTYSVKVLNDEGEWVLDMYDIAIDVYSIKKIANHYKLLGYDLNHVIIVRDI